VGLASAAGLVAVAVTDHDTIDGLAEAEAASAPNGIEVIRGCEISTSLDGRSVHVLAHGFPEHAPILDALLERARQARTERNAKILDRLASFDMPLGAEEVERHATGRVVARPHIAKAMVDRGYVPDSRTAFDRYLKDGGPAWVVVGRSSPAEAVTAVRDAGGAATIAHPRQIRLEGRATWERFFGELTDAGLVGIEVEHPGQRAEDRAFFGELADRFGLVRVGGTDFHGEVKPHIRIGTGDGTIDVGYETWERLRERRMAPRTP
jgi:predicted metal-dependent phosphoesterase TrpH